MVMLSSEQRTRGQARMSTTPVVAAGGGPGPPGARALGVAGRLGGRAGWPGTVAARLRVAGMVLDGLGGDAAADGLEDLTPRRVLAVLRSWGPLARRRSSELRAFLRYLRAAGYTVQDLAAAVFPARPGSAPRRAARLDPAQATAVLDGLERSGERGKRDYAVLLLAGVPLAGVAQVLGHRALAVTAGHAALAGGSWRS